MIPPYQAATEEIRRQAQTPKKLLNTAIGVGTTLVGGTALTKVLPLLNKFVPGELMRKGLSKVNPRIGGFIDTAINNGYSLDNIRDFLNEKFTQGTNQSQSNQANESQQQQDPLQEFESTYPDLAKALSGYINQGQPPESAAAILKNSSSFAKRIGDLEKNLGKNFVDYVLELFGGQQSQQSQQSQQAQQPQQQVSQQPQANQPQQPQANQPQQAQGLDPQLMQLINGIRSSIQQIRGNP